MAFKLNKGRRSVVKWVRDVPTDTGKWYTLSVVISGNDIKGILNGKTVIHFKTAKKIEGKIGLWSKADSFVLFDDLKINDLPDK